MQQPTIDKTKLYREFTALMPPFGDLGYTPEALEAEADKVWEKCKTRTWMDAGNYFYNVAVHFSALRGR